MSTVDRRVVEMNFDNKGFESGVKTSLKSLEDLKKGLNLDAAVKSLTGLATAGKSFSLAGIGAGVSTLSSRFSAFGIAGMAIINRLTNAAIDMGKKIFNSVSGFEAIKSGLSEYETQINAIQTILANTSAAGTTLDDVSGALAVLNTYADKTIYNFTEMTRNIGTFTAAGIDLDTSVAAIKGIANLAAVSGSNSQQASTAMYQLSQAMAAGTVRLMDWNSVVNAGMGGEVFKKALQDTARASGIAIDDILEKTGGFRQSLAEEWLTTDILTATLKKFTGDLTEAQILALGYTEEETAAILKMGVTANDAATKVKTFTQLKDTLKEMAQSGWTQSWETVLGDFNQAKVLFTEMSDSLGALIDASSKSRNEMLSGWSDLGGRVAMIDALRAAFEGVVRIMAPIKEALREIFPPMTSQQLFDFTVALKELAHRLLITEPTAEKLKRAFKGVFAIFSIAGQAISAVSRAFFKFAEPLGPASKNFLDIAANVGDFLVKLNDSIRTTNAFGKALENVGTFLRMVRDRIMDTAGDVAIFAQIAWANIKDFVAKFAESFKIFKNVDTSGITSLIDRIKVRFAPFTAMAGVFRAAFQGIVNVVKKLMPGFYKLAGIAGDALGSLGDTITAAINNLEFNSMVDIFNSGLLAAILLGVKKFLQSGTDAFGGVVDILDTVKDSLSAWQQSLKAETLFKIAAALGILTLSIVALSLIDSAKLTLSLTAVGVMFAQLMTSLALFDKIASGTGLKNMGVVVVGMLGMSLAILILSAAVTNLARLEWDELTRGVIGVGLLSAILVTSAKVLSSNAGSMIKGGLGLIAFAAGLNVLVLAVWLLSKLDPGKMQQGLVGIGILFAELALFVQLTGNSQKVLATAVGITVLAGALNVMAIAVGNLGGMDPLELKNGLLAIGLILTELAIFVQLIGDGKKVLVTAVGITILSGAVNLLALAIERIGGMSPTDIQEGLAGIAAGLLVLIAAVMTMPPDLGLKALGMVALSASLVIMADALTTMGSMSWEEIAKSLVVLTGALLILAGGLYLMTATIAGAAALVVAAAALAILAPALKALGGMSWEEIARGLAALAATFAVLGIAGLVLAPVVPSMLAVAGAIFLFGVAAAAFGVGAALFGVGLTAIATSGVAAAGALVILITSVVGLLPMIVEQAGFALVALIGVIKAAVPALYETIKLILLSLIDLIVEVTPPLVDAIVKIVPLFLAAIVEMWPQIIQSGIDLITAFLTGIRDNIGKISTLAIEIILAYIGAVTEQIGDIVNSAYGLIVAFIDGMALAMEENLPNLIAAVKRLAIAIVDGLIAGFAESDGTLKEAMNSLGTTALGALKDFLGIKSPSKEFKTLGAYSSAGFAEGIDGESGGVAASMTAMATELLAILEARSPEFETVGKTWSSSIGRGMTFNVRTNVEIARNMVTLILAEFNSRSQQFINVGKILIAAFTSGISSQSAGATAAAANMAQACLNQVNSFYSNFWNAGKYLAQGFAQGIWDNAYLGSDASYAMALAALRAAQEAIDSHSPSRKFAELGKFADQGFAQGIINYAYVAKDAASDLGDGVVSSLSNVIGRISEAINSDIDMSPTIRPVIDLTDVAAGGKQISDILGKTKGLNFGVSANKLATLSSNMLKPSDVNAAQVGGAAQASSLSFVQNNYSPTALSRLEIYRQTKNQFNTMKGLVGG